MSGSGVRAVPPEDSRWLARRLAPILAVSAALKLFLAWRFPGFLTGDDLEVVQTAAK